MTNAGYSGTPLLKKLGITSDTSLRLINAPENYEALVGKNVKIQEAGPREVPDLIHLFVVSKAGLEKNIQAILPLTIQNPKLVIWVSWYKKAAKKPTDVTEDVIRDVVLQTGLVDIKVCAVSELWSGLKLVVRKKK